MSLTAGQIPESCKILTFDQAIEPVTDEGRRVDRSDYLSEGSLPVIDQGEEFIGGYTNDTNQRYNGPLPVIVFGDHTRRVKLIDFPFVVGAQGVKLLKPKDCWEPRFLAYLLPTLPLQNRGYGRHYQYLRQLKFLCPPKSNQREIVAEIERQFTWLEAGVAGLRRVQANLKRYRAAVLKAACGGKLVPTEAELARQEGRTYETGAQLLKRTLELRLLSRKADKKGFSIPEGDAPSEIPEGWIVCSIDQIAECLDARRVPVNKAERARRTGAIPYYGANGQVGFIDKHIFDEPLVLVVEDETFTGRTQAFSYMIQGKSWVNNHAHVLRASSAVSTRYLNYSLAHYPFTPRSTGSTGRRKLTQRSLLTAPYLLPPAEEQTRIVAEVERRLSVVDEIEAVANANLQRATRLRQAILQQAFEGRL